MPSVCCQPFLSALLKEEKCWDAKLPQDSNQPLGSAQNGSSSASPWMYFADRFASLCFKCTCDHAAKKEKHGKTHYVSDVKYKQLYVTTLLCHNEWKSRRRQPCFLCVPFACLPTLTFNWKVGLLSDLLLTLSSHTVSPPARRLFNSPRRSLFPLSCNQWLPPLELLMSPQWLHWDCCQVTEDSCSGWLLLAHHWLGWWEHSFAFSFEFVDLCSRIVPISSRVEWRQK